MFDIISCLVNRSSVEDLPTRRCLVDLGWTASRIIVYSRFLSGSHFPVPVRTSSWVARENENFSFGLTIYITGTLSILYSTLTKPWAGILNHVIRDRHLKSIWNRRHVPLESRGVCVGLDYQTLWYASPSPYLVDGVVSSERLTLPNLSFSDVCFVTINVRRAHLVRLSYRYGIHCHHCGHRLLLNRCTHFLVCRYTRRFHCSSGLGRGDPEGQHIDGRPPCLPSQATRELSRTRC